jgi:hypothetical protein
MLVAYLVAGAGVCFSAIVRISCRQFDDVLVDMAFVYEVKMPVVQVVNVIRVFDSRVRAVVTVFVCVAAVSRVFHARSIHPG